MKEKKEKAIRQAKQKRREEGITLVALIVTIIVLLILAGVSISLVFNSDGLFEKANSAASKYNTSKEEELDFLQKTDEYLNKYNGIYGGGSTGTPNPTGTATPTPGLPEVGATVPESGWTIEEAKGLVARDGLKAHLGEKVQYSPAEDPEGVYRIFYYDNEVNSQDPTKGYFGDALNTLYLKRDYVSNDTNLSNYTSYATTDNGAIMKQMNPKWAGSTAHNPIDQENEHCVAWLCDSSQWTKYKVDGVTNYAIGSPSVEMYMKAFGVYKEADGDPDRNSTALVCKLDDESRKYGYLVGANNSYSNTGYNTDVNTIEGGPNSIFMTPGQYHWWLASPSSGSMNILLASGSSAYIIGNSYNRTWGVCPIVSII